MKGNLKFFGRLSVFLQCFLCSLIACAGNTWYVDAARPDDNGPGDTPETAWQVIQTAIDNSEDGDTILVAPGIYDKGGKVEFGVTNRVHFDNKQVTLRAISSDPADKTILGSHDPNVPEGQYAPLRPGDLFEGGGLGPGCVRGVYITSDATLAGFTVLNGHTADSTGVNGHGGGIRADGIDSTAVISNCVVIRGVARILGGGVAYGNYYDCVIRDSVVTRRTSTHRGGGAYGATLYRCVLDGNSAEEAGGARSCTLFDCIVRNSVYTKAIGGLDACVAYDTVIKDNPSYAVRASELYRCVISGHTANSAAGTGSHFESCVIFGNRGGSSSGSGLVSGGSTVFNSLIYGNDVGHDNRNMIVRDSLVVNSTIVSNRVSHTWGTIHATATLINSIVYYNYPGADFIAAADVSYTCTPDITELTGPGNITAEPVFVDMASHDFRLCYRNSPCIDAGTDVSHLGITNDIAGVTRPLAASGVGPELYDMGAYEYDPGPSGSIFRLF